MADLNVDFLMNEFQRQGGGLEELELVHIPLDAP
jgi:hypothetical protein